MKRIFIDEIGTEFIDKQVKVAGWVDSVKDLGSIIFIYIRDYTGLIQVKVDKIRLKNTDKFEQFGKVRNEFVIEITGILKKRPESDIKKEIKLGEFEIECTDFELINKCKPLPFDINMLEQTKEELRLKYRYLDLRNVKLKANLIFRHKFLISLRNFLDKQRFVEIETPVLIKSTPEGARDFIVPARNFKGKFYALPQSPQILKQLLQIAGFERYFQIVKCFRDEDLRANRQPEFTQIDIEMSFIQESDIAEITEQMFANCIYETLGVKIDTPFPRISYYDAMNLYGTDKPDIRLNTKIENISSSFTDTDIQLFNNVLKTDGVIKCIRFNNIQFSRNDFKNYENFIKESGGKGLIWLRYNGSINSNFKLLKDEIYIEKLQIKDSESLFIIIGSNETVNELLGKLRLKIANDKNLIKEEGEGFKFLWLYDSPLFELDKDSNTLSPMHHPFTAPKSYQDLDKKDKISILSRGYDLVLNGEEIASGSIRINNREYQEKVFKILGMDEAEYNKRFSFLLEALEFGAPVHGGIAFGFDRLIAKLKGKENIRDFIAFPKTTSGNCPLTNAPDYVDETQLKELGIKIYHEDTKDTRKHEKEF
jgi:aspartyl-tRNA synthetase